jgi:DNA-directed RNA polymerase subunit E'/Rpb7
MSFAQEASETIHLPISNVYSDVPIDHVILTHLQNTHEGRCSQYGFVFPESIEIVNRSLGGIITVDGQSKVTYQVEFRFLSLNPSKGDIYPCVVTSQTKMGLIGYMKHLSVSDPHSSPLMFIIPDKTLDPNTVYQVGKTYQVEILECRIKYKSTQIQAAGKVV